MFSPTDWLIFRQIFMPKECSKSFQTHLSILFFHLNSNQEGETLSDILNTWQPKKRAPGGSGPQTALFERLLNAIKEKLGGAFTLVLVSCVKILIVLNEQKSQHNGQVPQPLYINLSPSNHR